MNSKSVIYARVSSDRQARDNSIASQMDMCRRFAADRGLTVIHEFKDDGFSGADPDRPALIKMLSWLKKNPGITVIAYDTSRLARDVVLMNHIYNKILACACLPQFVVMNIDNTPVGRMTLNLTSSVDAFMREQNAAKVRASMLSQMQNGTWLLHLPIGYKRTRNTYRRIVIVRDEPTASILSSAIEKFADDQLNTKQDVANFLSARLNRAFNRNHAKRLVENPVYTGYFPYKKWNIPAQKWNIEPIVSQDIYRRVMAKIQGIGRALPASNIMADFPLRGYVLCGHCGKPLTACWAKGRAGRYPYYFCRDKECVAYGKTVRRDLIEEQMSDILKSVQADDDVMAILELVINDVSLGLKKDDAQHTKELSADISAIDKEINALVGLITQKAGDSIVTHFENKLRDLDGQRKGKQEELDNLKNNSTPPEYRSAFARTMEFVRTPYKLFEIGGILQKHKVLRMVFRDKPRYLHGQGFRTPKTRGIFSLSALSADGCINWWS